MEAQKKTVTAFFPGGIGKIEISIERAEQIKRLQTIIKGRKANEIKPINESTNIPVPKKSTLQ